MAANSIIRKFLAILTTLFQRVENIPLSFVLMIGTFVAIIGARLFMENALFGYARTSGSYYLYEFSHTLTFFSLTFILISVLFSWYYSRPLRHVATVLLCGYILILLPPLIDVLIAHFYFPGESFLSYYEFDSLRGLVVRFYTFYGADPTNGITYGVRVEVALTLMLLFFYGLAVSHRFMKALLFLIPTYIVLFVLGTFPAWVTLFVSIGSEPLLGIQASDVAKMFLSPTRIFAHDLPGFLSALNAKMSLVYTVVISCFVGLIYWLHDRRRAKILFFALRPLQMIYHVGLLSVGMGIGILLTNEIWFLDFFTITAFIVLCISVVSAWISATVVNDLFDQETDRISNKKRPLVNGSFSAAEYRLIGWLTGGLSVFAAMIVQPKLAGFIIAYLALTWIYNTPPLRLKRIPFVASFTAALASFFLVLLGYSVFSPAYSIVGFPPAISILFMVTLTISLPLKDLKDIEGDQKTRTWTLPVLIGPRRARLIIASGIFFSYLLSVVLLHIQDLLIWAIIFGAVSFWLVIVSDGYIRFITARNILGWIFFVTALYGIIIVKTLFL